MKQYEDTASAKGITTKQHLDDLAQANKLRKSAYKKWINKFEEKFHKHFDGEIKIKKFSNRNRTPALWLEGAHNHLVNGTLINIKTIRRPKGFKFSNLPDDIPFIANVEMRYNNRFLPKRSTSTFFQKIRILLE